MQCIKTVQKSKVLIRNEVSDAVELLHDLGARKPVKQWWPAWFKRTYEAQTGTKLV